MNILCKKICIGYFSFFLLCSILGYQYKNSIGLLCATLILVIFAYLIITAIKLTKSTQYKLPLKPFFYALALIFIAPTADYCITLYYSPDLSREANAFVLTMLENNLPLPFIYIIMAIWQISFAIFALLTWSYTIKMYPLLLKKIPSKNILTTTKWLFGMGQIHLKNIDFSAITIFLGYFIIGLYIIRFYAVGLWLEIIPFYNSDKELGIILISMFLAIFVSYILYSHYKIKYLQKTLKKAHPIISL